MTRVAALAAALAAALVAGSEAPAKVEGRLFGLLGTQSGQFVIEVDPGTFEPLPGRRLRVAPANVVAPWTLDPSRHTLAIAHGNRLRLIDLASLRAAGSVKLDLPLEPSGVLWLRPDRIVLLRRGFERYQVAVVDLARRRIVSRREIADGSVVDSERTQSEVVMLRAPMRAIGPASLLIVGGDGEAREIPLPRIQAGTHVDMDLTPPLARGNRPALALDPQRRVAYVVSPDGLVAEVPLEGEAVRYHAVHGRFAKLFSGSVRQALIVAGKIVVTGSDSTVGTDKNGKPAMRTDPAGLELIDPATWQTRRLADGVSSVVPSPGGFLAVGGSWNSESQTNSGMGLAAYSADGLERFRMFEGKLVWVFAVYGGKACLQVSGEGQMRVIDLDSGRVIGSRQGRVPWLLLEENAAVW